MTKLYFKDLETDNIEVYLDEKKVADVVRDRERFVYLITIVESGKKLESKLLAGVLPKISGEL